MKRISLSLFVALVFALSSGVVSSFAAEGSHMDMDGSHMEGSHMDKDMGNVAIGGHCPVCIMHGQDAMGNPHFATEYKGKIYYFVGFDQQKEFLNNPEKYIQGLEKKYKEVEEKMGKGMNKEEEMEHMPEGSH